MYTCQTQGHSPRTREVHVCVIHTKMVYNKLCPTLNGHVHVHQGGCLWWSDILGEYDEVTLNVFLPFYKKFPFNDNVIINNCYMIESFMTP